MIKKLLFVLIAAWAIGINAQESKKDRLFIDWFTETENVSEDDSDKVRAAVISALNASERFELLDVASMSSIEREAYRRGSAEAMNDETARTEAIAVKANKYILDGEVTACSVKSNAKDGKSSFTCVLTYSITITDVANNTTVATKKFDHQPTGLGGFAGKLLDESTSAEGAKTSAINMVSSDIESFLIEEFPLTGTIFGEDFVVKKEKLTQCYIDLGSAIGVKIGDYFSIYEVQTKVGKTIDKEIGKIKVIEVDEEIANCKVTKGEKEVKKAMDRYLQNLQAEQDIPEEERKTKPLKVKSAPAPLFSF